MSEDAGIEPSTVKTSASRQRKTLPSRNVDTLDCARAVDPDPVFQVNPDPDTDPDPGV